MIAVYVDPELKRHSLFIKASIEYLLNTLGYQFRYIDSFNRLITTDTLLYYSQTTPDDRTVVSFALKRPVIMIPFDEEIYNLDKIKSGRIEKLKRNVKLISEVPILSQNPVDTPVKIMSNEYIVIAKYNFDLIGNIMFFLSSKEKEIRSDEDGQFNPEDSYFYQDFDKPFVSEYLQSFEHSLRIILEKKGFYLLKKDYWPSGEDFAFAASHTANKLKMWTYPKIFNSFLDILMLIPKFKFSIYARQMKSIYLYMFRNEEQYWSFEEYSDIESKYGINSSWFIAVDDDILTDYLFNDKDLQGVIQELEQSEQDVSLLSFPEKESIDQLCTNEKRLKIATTKSAGVRNSDYKTDSSTLSKAGRAGLLYDSSDAFINKVGFPKGMVFPYKPITAKYRSDYYSYPVNYNDDALILGHYKTVMFKQAKIFFKICLDEVKKSKGLLCSDMKLPNFIEVPFQGKLYNFMLENITDEFAYKGTLMEINKWWKKRAEVVAFEEEFELSIDFQEAFENFTFKILGSKVISEIVGAEYTSQKNSIHFTNIAKDAKVYIKFSATDTK